MATNDRWKVSAIGREQNYGSQIVFDWGLGDLTSSAHVDTVAICTAFQTMAQTKMLAALPSKYGIERWRCACVSGDHKGEIGHLEVSPPQTGGLGENTLPNEIAISCKRSTGYSSRHDRGRIFLGPVDQANFFLASDPDVVQNIGLAETFAGTMATAITVAGTVLSPMILSAAGVANGNHVVLYTSVARTFVHRRSRRTGIGQ